MQWLDKIDDAINRAEIPGLLSSWQEHRGEEERAQEEHQDDPQQNETTTTSQEQQNQEASHDDSKHIVPEPRPTAPTLSSLAPIHDGLATLRDNVSEFCSHPPTLSRHHRYMHRQSSSMSVTPSARSSSFEQGGNTEGEESAEFETFVAEAPSSGTTPLSPEGSMLVARDGKASDGPPIDESDSTEALADAVLYQSEKKEEGDSVSHKEGTASIPRHEIDAPTLAEEGSRLPLSISIEREESNADMISNEPDEDEDETDSVDEFSDFDFGMPLAPWIADSAFTPLEASKNSHGVVHVRLIAAQRLSCPAGSMVQAIAALPPWKGRVRTEPTRAFLGPDATGVCVRWDHLTDAGFCSMVHAWNNQDTPIPTLAVDVMFQPLNVMEFTVCTLRLSCDPLMRSPGVWKKQWCAAMTPRKLETPRKEQDQGPLVLLEAMFLPDDFEGGSVTSCAGGDETDDVGEISAPPTPVRTASVTKNASTKTSHSGRSIGSMPSFMLSARNPKKLHLMRVQSFFVPATCSVCSTLIVGWKRGYRCEACSIDCCADCQLQVDLQLPCGSSLAREAVESAIQSKMTMSSLMNVVAPVSPDRLVSLAKDDEQDTNKLGLQKLESVVKDKPSIGSLTLGVVRACIFKKALSPDADPHMLHQMVEDDDVRAGDHYVRISMKGNQESSRTQTVQNTGKPQFDSADMTFDMPHYGIEYRIEVIDATTDNPIGTALLTAQGLLQQERDVMVSRDDFAVISPFRAPQGNVEKRRVTLELRSDVKSGFSSDFFVSPRTNANAKSDDSSPGKISGWIEVDLCISEDMHRLYGSTPVECPPRPPEELNLEMFQLHMARIGALVKDIKHAVGMYTYTISWQDPALTGLSLIIFVTFCLRFNTEYIGSLPVFSVIVVMLYLASVRKRGHLKDRFIARETAARTMSEKNSSVKYAVHRPIGSVEVRVQKGTDIRSRDTGLPGSVGCRVYWDPLRYVQRQQEKDKLLTVDISLKGIHVIGETNYQFSANPVWDNIEESEETKRLQQLIPSEGSFFESRLHQSDDTTHGSSEARPMSLRFPVLQPIKIQRKRGTQDGVSANDGFNPNVHLEPWGASQGAVVVEVRFQDVLNRLPGFDDVFGEIAVPVSKLAENGQIQGWFQVCNPGTTRLIPVSGNNTVPAAVESEGRPAKVFVALEWRPPTGSEEDASTDKEASIVVAEELIRSAARSEQGKLDLIGSSLGALNTVRGLSGHVLFVQNLLGSILDIVESIRNAFNFTDPFKSSVVLAALILLWVFLALVPTRALILAGGMAQYAFTFITAFGPGSKYPPNKTTSDDDIDEKEARGNPIVIWVMNAIRGLPTDEDLRKAYFWESRRVGEQESQRLASQKRSTRLQRLWKAQWYSSVQIKKSGPPVLLTTEDRQWHWSEVFAMVQGRRFLWWPTAQDFDNGEAPLGRIFLAGHAGLAGLSPLDLRELHQHEVPSVTSIFGRGIDGQQKITLRLDDEQAKEALEAAIIEASSSAKED